MRRTWLALMVVLAWTGAAIDDARAALSPEAFTQEFASALRAALPKGHKVEIVAPLHLRITDGEGGESTSFLDNAYRQYQADPDSRQELIELRVKSVLELADTSPLKPANIVPIIKDHAWVTETNESVRAASGKVASERVTEALNDVLVIVYAEDTPTNISYFTPEDLAKAGVDRAKLRALAVENLRRILPQLEVHRGEAFSMVNAGGTYEASLLLLDDLWNGDTFKVDGEIVVALPSRDVLLVTGSKNRRGLVKMREAATELFEEGSYTLTKELMVYRNGRFERFAP